VAERVKTPATAVPGTHFANIKSKRPSYLTPDATAENETPSILGIFGKATGANGDRGNALAIV